MFKSGGHMCVSSQGPSTDVMLEFEGIRPGFIPPVQARSHFTCPDHAVQHQRLGAGRHIFLWNIASSRNTYRPQLHCVKVIGQFALLPYSHRSEEHTSELQSLMSISYAVFCL